MAPVGRPSFAATYVGATAVSSLVLRSPDTTVSVAISVTGDFSSTKAGSQTISAGGSLQVPLTFAPTAAGSRTGSVRVQWRGGSFEVDLAGTGLAAVAPSVDGGATFDFQTVVVGRSLGAPFLLTNPRRADNPADEPCTVTAAIGAGYTVSPSGPQTVAEGGKQAFTVTFAPTAAAAYPATLTLSWSRAGLSGVIEVAVTGTGYAPATADSEAVAVHVGEGPTVSGEQRQRAGWYVPTHRSYVSLGQAWTPEASEQATQTGFTASTSAHVFLRAAGSVTLQATNGPVWLQSENGPLYSVSGKGTYMVAASTLFVGGGGYVGIMAGYAGEPIPQEEMASYDDGDPLRPAPVDQVAPAFLAADLVWQITDKLILLATAAKLVEHTVALGKHNEALGRIVIGISVAAQAASLGSFILAKATGAPEKTINLYSQAGILVGTPAFASLYGGLGVNYRSANITLLGNVAVAVNSIVSTSLDSVYGDTAVSSSEVNATSWVGTFLYSTLGPAKLLGRDITLGGFEPDGMQLPTLDMQLESVSRIEVVANGPTSTIRAKARAVTVWPDPLSSLTMKTSTAVLEAPTTTIRLNTPAGPVWTVEASPTGISIKNKAGEVLSLKDGLITLGPTGGQIQLAAASTTIGGGAMVISDAQLAVSGFGELL